MKGEHCREGLKDIIEERAYAEALIQADGHAEVSERCVWDGHELGIIVDQALGGGLSSLTTLLRAWSQTSIVQIIWDFVRNADSQGPTLHLGIHILTSPSGGADVQCSLMPCPFIECKHMAGAYDHYGARWMDEWINDEGICVTITTVLFLFMFSFFGWGSDDN